MTYIKNETIKSTDNPNDSNYITYIKNETIESYDNPDNLNTSESNNTNKYTMTNTKMIMYVALIMISLLGIYYLYSNYISKKSKLDNSNDNFYF